ncbi:hypothetical protein GE09DRAFT_1092214, partial [Coniochaeta sp. 2T2.1]
MDSKRSSLLLSRSAISTHGILILIQALLWAISESELDSQIRRCGSTPQKPWWGCWRHLGRGRCVPILGIRAISQPLNLWTEIHI